MKVLAVVRGFPPESDDALAARARAACVALARSGVDVVVWSATSRPTDADRVTRDAEGGFRVRRFRRADPHPEHWHKSLSDSAGQAFEALVRAEAPDVVHVHHWSGLTRDLVLRAARAGRPALVSLHDAWTACLIGTRVRPVTHEACDAPLGAQPCLACASSVEPRTPWVPIEAQFMALAERQRDLARELQLARAVLVHDPDLEASLVRWLAASDLALEFVALDGPDLARALGEVYARAARSGPPELGSSPDDWFSARLRAFAESEWDRRQAESERDAAPRPEPDA